MTGILCLDKPKDMTSFTAVKRVSRILGIKKAGHTGTLDPLATGVLVIMLSRCTRFIELLPEHEKSYTAKVKLGLTTDTLDITGKVLTSSPVGISENELLNAAEKFKGEIMQTPPMYSAIKVDGERLYNLARKGIEKDRIKRKITVKNLEIYGFDGTEFSMSVTCSAGTYIRSLCDDIGKELGCGACMTELRRTKANGFSVENAVTLEELQKIAQKGQLNKHIVPIDAALNFYEAITVTAPQAVRFKNGGALDRNRLHKNFENGIYRVYSPDEKFLGLGELSDSENVLAVKRVFTADE